VKFGVFYDWYANLVVNYLDLKNVHNETVYSKVQFDFHLKLSTDKSLTAVSLLPNIITAICKTGIVIPLIQLACDASGLSSEGINLGPLRGRELSSAPAPVTEGENSVLKLKF
jgi:hypothetical protein